MNSSPVKAFYSLIFLSAFGIMSLSEKKAGVLMNADYLVKLYELPSSEPACRKAAEEGVTIHRAMGLDRGRILDFVAENFSPAWVGEASLALSCQPTTCFIAVKEKKVVGFACYDATAKGFFGPTGVLEECRGKGVGSALLYRTLEAMREAGYGYAVIGWVSDAVEFYRKSLEILEIPGSFPGVYRHMIDQN